MKASYFIKNNGYKHIILKNDRVIIAAVPELGGRITEYSVEGCNVLYVNSPHKLINTGWMNYGGYKAWPAPQNMWGWPPPYELDSGSFSYEVYETAQGVELHMLSPVSDSLGIQFERKIFMPDTGSAVILEEGTINHGSKEKYIGIWGIGQVATPGTVLIRQDEDSGSYSLKVFKEFDMPRSSSLEILDYDPLNVRINCGCGNGRFKLGILSKNTLICYNCKAYDRSMILTICFRFEGRGIDYPHGCNIEVYNDELNEYAELEALSPMYKLQPGEKKSISMKWDLRIE
ncbi:MAG: hypothetical protein ACOZCL_03240 [Bacillota bacterium]